MALMELQSWCDSNGKGLKIYVARELVRYTHIFFSSNFCHHGSGGAAVDSPPSQQDPYLSIRKGFKLLALLRNYGISKFCG
jgi:hypothetical protein